MIQPAKTASLPLLFHENVMRGVINYFGTENRFCHMVVSSSSRRQILLAIENELIAVGSHTGSDVHTSQFESENVAILLLAFLKEFDRLPVFQRSDTRENGKSSGQDTYTPNSIALPSQGIAWNTTGGCLGSPLTS